MTSTMNITYRHSPVQAIQSRSPWLNVYPDAVPNPLRASSHSERTGAIRNPLYNPGFVGLASAPREPPREVQISAPAALALPHAHPAPKRWSTPGGWGSRHIHDKAAFNLWNATEREFRGLTRDESRKIWESCNDVAQISTGSWCICVETNHPPKPIPLTWGGMPIIFRPVGQGYEDILPNIDLSNRRVPDPCPWISWGRMDFPKHEQHLSVMEAMEPLANIRTVRYCPVYIMFELEKNDGREYALRSLPGTVAKKTALYHHDEAPFMVRPKAYHRERQQISSRETQDAFGYLQQADYWSPGCRVESVIGATTSGLKLRRQVSSGIEEILTVAHHGILDTKDLYHPTINGTKVGEVVDAKPHLDVSFVKLEPNAAKRYRNDCYFQAEAPKKLLRGDDIKSGTWFDVDGMSSGFMSLMAFSKVESRVPPRPAGHPLINFRKWRTEITSVIFGVVNEEISAGICGAPIVDETGGVGGFFHLAAEPFCYTAVLDDIINEGWEIV